MILPTKMVILKPVRKEKLVALRLHYTTYSQRIYFKNSNFKDQVCCTAQRFLQLVLQPQLRLEFIFKGLVSIGCSTEMLRNKFQKGCYIV